MKPIANRTNDDIQINKYLHNGLVGPAIIGHKKHPLEEHTYIF
jgi:hypothetical protein